MKRYLSAGEILTLLEDTSGNWWQTRRTLLRHASVAQLMEALKQTSAADTRQVLCDLLGYRQAKRAVKLLLAASMEESLGVQCAAVDALAKIGDPRSGAQLLDLLEASEDKPPLFSMIVVALGAVRHAPAAASLIALLDHEKDGIRGGAVWSLGQLMEQAALPKLKAMQNGEPSAYVRERLREAISSLERQRG